MDKLVKWLVFRRGRGDTTKMYMGTQRIFDNLRDAQDMVDPFGKADWLTLSNGDDVRSGAKVDGEYYVILPFTFPDGFPFPDKD